MTGAKGKLLDGWQVLGITQMRSGNPLTVFVQNNRSRSQWAPSLGPGLDAIVRILHQDILTERGHGQS
jgi:hypothetical protein